MASRFDIRLVLAVVSIMGASLVNLYGVSTAVGSFLLVRQSIWCLTGLVVLLLCSSVRATFWEKAAPALYAVGLAGLALVLLVGEVRGGTRGWFSLGPVSLQPSEFCRLGTMLLVASYLAKKEESHLDFRSFAATAAIVIAPVVLILREPDLGVALTYVPILIVGWWLGGVHFRVWAALAIVAALGIGVAWSTALKPYQKERVLTVIDPSRDPFGAGYQVQQSRIAVGSGRLLGQGLGRGPQSVLRFLPAQHTDFAFAAWTEATGFAGGTALLLAFGVLFWRLGALAEKTDRRFSVAFAAVVIGWLAFQSVVNLGMVLGWLPTTGITLPLFSYGGSSVISTCATFGVVHSLWRHRLVNQ